MTIRYDGTHRVVDNRPFFGCDVDGQQMEVGLFPHVGFQLGCFVNGEWVPIKRSIPRTLTLMPTAGCRWSGAIIPAIIFSLPYVF